MNRIPVLPTLLTLGNGVCGFASIAYASKITRGDSLTTGQIDYYFLLSAALILVAMVFDMLDGYAARLSHHSPSEFGGRVWIVCATPSSFGRRSRFSLAPAGPGMERSSRDRQGHRRHRRLLHGLRRAAAGAVQHREHAGKHHRPQAAFKGLPSPAAAGCIVSLTILRSDTTIATYGLNVNTRSAVLSASGPPSVPFVAALLMGVAVPHIRT